MPLKITRIASETDVGGLARELYTFQGRNARAAEARASEALIRANPWLRNVDRVTPGTVVVVPDGVGSLRNPDAAEDAESGGEELLSEMSRRVDVARSLARANFKAARTKLDQALSTLSDEQVQSELKRAAQESGPLLDAARADLEAQLSGIDGREETLVRSLDEADAAIAELGKLARPNG